MQKIPVVMLYMRRNRFLTYQPLPEIVEDEPIEERLSKLIVWSNSLDGHLYSIGSALTELRKEIAELKRTIRNTPSTKTKNPRL